MSQMKVGSVYKHPSGSYVYVTSGPIYLSPKTAIDAYTWRLVTKRGHLGAREFSGPSWPADPLPLGVYRFSIPGYTSRTAQSYGDDDSTVEGPGDSDEEDEEDEEETETVRPSPVAYNPMSTTSSVEDVPSLADDTRDSRRTFLAMRCEIERFTTAQLARVEQEPPF